MLQCARRLTLSAKERRMKRKGGEEIGTKEKKRTKREMVTKESDTVMGWTRVQGGKGSRIPAEASCISI